MIKLRNTTGQGSGRHQNQMNLGGFKRWFSPQGQDTAFILSCIGLLALDQSMCKVFMLFIMFIALRYFVADFVADFVVAPEMMR
jgi:hypothetical protein